MKKLLLAAAICTGIGTAAPTKAQVWSENFNSGSLPSGWVLINDGNTVSSSFTSSSALQTALNTNAWSPLEYTNGDYVMITTSYFSSPDSADRWLLTPQFQVTDPNMVLEWDDYDLNSEERLQVLISSTGGTTASSFSFPPIYDEPADPDNLGATRHAISLGAHLGQTIRVAFRDHTYDNWGLIVDNVEAAIYPYAVEGQVTGTTFPNYLTTSTPVTVSIRNNGAQTMTNVTLEYSIDGGSPVSETFNTQLGPLGVTSVTFATPVSGLAMGSHSITINLTQVNGTTDPDASNNSITSNFIATSGSSPRNGLVEEFTSSTCVPCASFNAIYDPMILSNNANDPASHFNVIRYQMNWPSPGTDASYNNDGKDRRSYYQVNAVPHHFVNGKDGIRTTQAALQDEIDNSKLPPAPVDIAGTYVIKGDSLLASVIITPKFTSSAVNATLYMAATEEHYVNNGATTSQKNYYHVMRKMLPDADGIALTNFVDGVSQTFTQSYKFSVGTVTQMSNTFWGSPFVGNLVVFLQDDVSHEILQSVSIPAQWPTGIDNIDAGIMNVKIFPNPARDMAHVNFSLEERAHINIKVMNMVGETVYTSNENLNTGIQSISIPTINFASGVYNVVITSEKGRITEQLSVVK